ncbi:MAG: IMP dehydrogenase [Candidatus Yanofskybacteria bacterium]|nr:IMP dehydrogenase [Candidatus Yanofskybacteria bacterium]
MPKSKKIEQIFEGATYGDFLFRPQFSVVKSRRDVDLTMPLTRNIRLNVPIVGANMDTVTREKMMKTLSLEGCFGFLDRNCSIVEQAARVKHVKRQHSFVIENPIMIPRKNTVADAGKILESQNISTLLVEEGPGSGTLAGILTHRDLLAAQGKESEPLERFMTPFRKLVTASPNISMNNAENMMLEERIEKLPLINKNRKITGLITMRDLRLAKQKPYSTKDKKGRLMVGAAIGAAGDYMERADALVSAGVDCVLMDVAHSHSDIVKVAVKKFKSKFKSMDLICGNVATKEGAKFLMDLGADGIKVGIGPGRGCRTRLEVGAGVPQLQAVREAYLAVQGRVPIIADGGVGNDKDIALAILSGASTVMLGSMLSGTDESPGIVIEDPSTRRKVKMYRGMTSAEAVIDNFLKRDPEDVLTNSQAQEGQSVTVPYVGSVTDVIKRIKDHLRSAVSYAGEKDLYGAHKKVSSNPADYFIRLSDASRKESFER